MGDISSQAVATLIGALAAFGLEAVRRQRKERAEETRRFKEALFVLLLQRTYLRNLYEQQLSTERPSPIRAFTVRPIMAVPPQERFDLPSLSFLLDGREVQLLNALALSEARYRTVVALIEQRNALHLAFQSRLQAVQVVTGVNEATPDQLRAIAGPLLGRALERLTDDLYDAAEKSIGFNRECYEEAVAVFKRLYPKAHMFGVEDVPIPRNSAT